MSGNAKNRGDDFVLGIDLGGSKAILATATLGATQFATRRIEYAAEDISAQGLVDRALSVGAEMLEKAARDGVGTCRAVGIVCPGVVEDHGVSLAPSRPGWERVQIVDRAQKLLGIETVVAGNDVKAAALAEWQRGSLRGADPALYVNLGTGVSAASIVGGRVLEGAHQGAGEIGYMRCLPSSSTCRDSSLLEELAGGGAIGRNVSDMMARPVSAVEAFESSEPVVKSYLEEVLYELATAVATVALVTDPARIALGGGLMASGDAIFVAVNERLDRLPFRPDLVKAEFLITASLEGAISMAIAEVGETLTSETRVHA